MEALLMFFSALVSFISLHVPFLPAAAIDSQHTGTASVYIQNSSIPLSPRFTPNSYLPVKWQDIYAEFGANMILWAYSGPSYMSKLGTGTAVQCALPTRVQADGTVTKVDKSVSGRTTVSWSNQSSSLFKNVAAGTGVLVGSKAYQTILASTDGTLFLPSDASVANGNAVYLLADATFTGNKCLDRSGNTYQPFGSGVPEADVNSPSWRAYMLSTSQTKVDQGCRMFQQDEPGLNGYNAQYWNGCFSDDSMKGFNAYLKQNLSASQLSALGISNVDSFNFRSQNTSNESLKTYFIAYQKQATADFLSWLHKSISDYAAANHGGAAVSFGSNIGWGGDGWINQFDWLAKEFDYAVAEFYARPEDGFTPTTELAALRDTASWYRSHYAHTSALTVPSTDVTFNKRMIASAYPLGLVVIAPWDVYQPAGMPRFFGKPSDYANLYSMVSSNKNVFDGYAFLSDSGVANGLISSLPAAGTPQPDGTVTKVDATKTAGRVTLSWTKQNDPYYKTISKGTNIAVGNATYATIADTGVGLLYLPAGIPVAVGDAVRFNVAPDPNAPDGYVTAVDTTKYPGRVALSWSKQTDAKFKTIAKGTLVSVKGMIYATVVGTGVGSLYLPATTVATVGDPVKFVPAPALNGADGYVTNVVASSSPARLIVSWSAQSDAAFKTIPKGTKVSIAGVVYSTVTATGVGSLYLPATAKAAIGDLVKINFSTGSGSGTGSGNGNTPGSGSNDGTGNSVPDFNNSKVPEHINLIKPALNELFAAATVTASAPSAAVSVSGSGSYFLVVSQSKADSGRRAVHVVNWGTNPAATTLTLRASDFPAPPRQLVTSSHPAPVTVTPTYANGAYTYNLGNLDTWAFVY